MGLGEAGRNANANYSVTYNSQNRRNGHIYDSAGNLTSDGGQAFNNL